MEGDRSDQVAVDRESDEVERCGSRSAERGKDLDGGFDVENLDAVEESL